MRDPIKVNFNDKRLYGLSLCIKCENRAESNFQSCDSSYTSFVDVLKSIGIDSSFENRKKIAIINGISDYSGTAKQNIVLLTNLKKVN